MLDYALLGLQLERSVTWRESYQKPRYWRKLLRSAPSLMRLSGLTCSASEAETGVASWRASLAASPANPIALQENGSELMTSETSGLSLRGWYGTLRQRGASSRTYQASLLTTGESYDQTYKPWATRLRKACSQRRRSARRIFGNASSGWPTAMAQDSEQAGSPNANMLTLNRASLAWPTPSTAPEAPNTNVNTVNGPTSLGEAASLWSTATAHDGRRPGSDATSTQGGNLKREAESWSTPNARDYKGQDLPSRQGVPSLPAQVMQMDGGPTSESGPASSPRYLNPRFVLALMGWPDLIGYESQETELYQWRQQMRSALSALGWEC